MYRDSKPGEKGDPGNKNPVAWRYENGGQDDGNGR